VSLCEPRFVSAANAIERAVETAIAQGQATRDVGGQFGTAAAGEAIARLLASA
jgi:3-isopropylmalate dehydrogenase